MTSNLLRALGMDTSLLAEGNDMSGRTRARDEGEDPVEAVIEALRTEVLNMNPDEHRELQEELKEITDHGDVSLWASDRRHGEDRKRRAEDRKRRRATDEPPAFSGRPRPSGEVDPVTVQRAADAAGRRRLAADTSRRTMAADSAATKSFQERFPLAARIGNIWNP